MTEHVQIVQSLRSVPAVQIVSEVRTVSKCKIRYGLNRTKRLKGWNDWNEFMYVILPALETPCAHFFTCADFFVAGKLLIDLPHGIGAVIADFGGSFVDFLSAFVAEPFEVIDFAGFALALEDDEPGVGLEARRVGHAGGTEEDLAGFDVRGVFFAGFVTVDEMLNAV